MMCNVGRFLWDVDSLWEMHVGVTGLRRRGGLIFFFFFLIVLFVGLGIFGGLFCFVVFLR